MDDASTKHPIVLIHGVFGYGRSRPLWNSWSPYWPERALREMHANHLIVDVGALSSDHDRACEAFYQLIGGTVDYGDAHSRDAGHNRYGETFHTPLHPNWSANHPIHLVGHSFGATTAIELYQLICQDYFCVGSDHRWVRSIVSIAGPLTGTTLTHLFGLHDASMRAYTLGHAIGSALGLYFKLHNDFPILKRVFAFRMQQWECVDSYREVLSATGRINNSRDLAVYDILPARRLERNRRLLDMDKVYLVSVVTSSHVAMPHIELALAAALAVCSVACVVTYTNNAHSVAAVLGGIAVVLTMLLQRRMQQLDYAAIPSMLACMVLMTQRVRSLHAIFDGFERREWERNDGAVNIYSMRRTWTLSTIAANALDVTCDDDASSASTTVSSAASSPRSSIGSIDFNDADSKEANAIAAVAMAVSAACSSEHDVVSDNDTDDTDEMNDTDNDDLLLQLDASSPTDCNSRKRHMERGRWYEHHVRKNHLAGTHFDSDAPELLRALLRVVAREFE